MDENHRQFREAIQEFFARVATAPGADLSFHSGRFLANVLGYPPPLLGRLPEEAIESFVGVGNPFQLGPVGQGESVLDIGCGSGFDCIVASHLVGPSGRVVGVDITLEMVQKATSVSRRLSIGNAVFAEGDAEALPVRPGSMDAIISNGALLFSTDKYQGFAQAHQALRPGGHLYLADVLIPDSMATDTAVLDLLGLGFQLESEYLARLEAAGFVDVELVALFDVTAGILGELDTKDLGLMGASIRGRKPPGPGGSQELSSNGKEG
jgi:SAM-dependent methyltransferase